MSIKDFTEKIKLFFGDIKDKIFCQNKGLKIKDDLYIVITIILVGTASFGLGKLSGYEKEKRPISILKTQESMYATVLEGISDTSTQTQASGEVLASKTGTKYYYPWCSGVSKIKETNRVWFKTIAEARARDLTPASNCLGLK